MRLQSAALALAAMATAAIVPMPVLAQARPGNEAIPVSDPQLEADIAFAERRGRDMYLYDQAAWHATDALVEEVDTAAIENPRGYIVVPRDGDAMLDTLFLQEVDGQLVSFARYTMDGSTVVSGEADIAAPVPLSPLAQRMAAVRGPAIGAMADAQYGLCSETPPNTLTLPPEADGSIAFYLLTSTVAEDTYPLGGHYRALVAPDGTVATTKRFMNSCFDLPLRAPNAPEGSVGRPGIQFIHGDVPSEIHVFASFYFPDGLYVITSSNDMLWLVEQGRITLAKRDFSVRD